MALRFSAIGFLMQATVAADSLLRANTQERHFYLWMAGAFVLIAFGGFTPTYWARLSGNTFPPIVHIHGALLFTWTLFYFMQTAWVASGRVPTHRAWGLAGIALFSVMVCSIIVTKVTLLRMEDARGFGDAARRFAAVALLALPLMIGLFSLAIANVRRPETHKRLMLVLMAASMQPAIARVMLTLFAPPGAAAGGPPPVFVTVPPGLMADLLIGVAMMYDWRTRGRPHKAYIYGGLSALAFQLLVVPISATQAWMSVARFVEGLAG
jgi:hypothetical protein